MNISRRQALQLAVGGAGIPALLQSARAQSYPTRPVHLVVTIPAGGSPDIVARLLGQWLSERMGQPFVIENRPGASGNIGTEFVVKAPADGYTLLMAMSANAINASFYRNLNFNFIRDTAPVARIGGIPLVLIENPSFSPQTVPELIAYAKVHPGQINMAMSGKGTPLDVAGELFKMMAGLDIVGVPYQGESMALPDLISGQVQVMFGVMPASLGYIKSGKLRALAVTTTARQSILPDVPAMNEFLPGFEATGWYGIVAPRATPSAIVETLNRQINSALADAEIRKRLVDLGCEVSGGSPGDLETFIAAESAKWANVIKFAGIVAQ